jgi:hypothetical protein
MSDDTDDLRFSVADFERAHATSKDAPLLLTPRDFLVLKALGSPGVVVRAQAAHAAAIAAASDVDVQRTLRAPTREERLAEGIGEIIAKHVRAERAERAKLEQRVAALEAAHAQQWRKDTDYRIGDVAYYEGRKYVCLVQHRATGPRSDAPCWQSAKE